MPCFTGHPVYFHTPCGNDYHLHMTDQNNQSKLLTSMQKKLYS